ncbi:IclR family transcriptional regulator [Geomonas subterranea]|uniref:IclR family transcriptional regulator n=1 Tax=Geomonas subterranea TaxID=2847989 RepID=A0ABX8LIX3_9BACT|nr:MULTISPECIES: IclR family transcriptional regulator [Geomonas]QXE91286.1 IclR family transcriptional regulator [Geomonas subterranea]QXM10628.1 IclR family transcriptional regulator [Geomonas subterranea]
MKKGGEKTNYNRSVSRALDVLEQFLGDDHEVGLTELSRRLKLPKNNVFRLLATLELRGYLGKDSVTERYQLGFKTVELSQNAFRQRGLGRSRAVMERLVRECNETACVSIMADYRVINLDAVQCDHNLRVIPALGVHLPAYCTAPGKSLMAHFAEEAIVKYASTNKFEKHTPHTIVDPESWKHQLRVIAQQGYAMEMEELNMGVTSVGAPIRDYTSRVIGALSILGPSQRFPLERMEHELVPLLKQGAADISARFGY